MGGLKISTARYNLDAGTYIYIYEDSSLPVVQYMLLSLSLLARCHGEF